LKKKDRGKNRSDGKTRMKTEAATEYLKEKKEY
jgi:hypothetical protein